GRVSNGCHTRRSDYRRHIPCPVSSGSAIQSLPSVCCSHVGLHGKVATLEFSSESSKSLRRNRGRRPRLFQSAAQRRVPFACSGSGSSRIRFTKDPTAWW